MYANKKVATENEMKNAEEKIEEMKQEYELLFVSGRRTHLERPDRLKQDEMNASKKLENLPATNICLFLFVTKTTVHDCP